MAVGKVVWMCPVSLATGARAQAGPADVEARDDVDPAFTVGGLYAINGKTYIYIKFNNGAGNIAAVVGQACYTHTLADWDPPNGKAQVTSDVSDAIPANAPAIVIGGFVNVITDGRYGFVQCGGRQAGVLSNANAAGDRLIASTTDGSLAEATAGGDIVEYVAVTLEAAA